MTPTLGSGRRGCRDQEEAVDDELVLEPPVDDELLDEVLELLDPESLEVLLEDPVVLADEPEVPRESVR